MKKVLYLAAIVGLIILVGGCNKQNFFNDDNHPPSDGKSNGASVATDWYRLQFRILLERNAAFNANAYIGYIGIGLYEAVRYGANNSISLSKKLNQMPAMPAKENNNGYNWQVSANAALAAMVRSFYVGLTPANMASIDSLENAYNQKLKPVTSSANFDRSQTFGRSIATAIYNWYLTDNLNASNTGYVPPVFPGSWAPTLPALANGIFPFLGSARPFLIANSTIVAPAFPAPYSEVINSAFYKIVKNVFDVSQTLTTDQKNIALFWVDQGNGIGYTPGGHDFFVLTQAIEQSKATLALAAEAFAKAGIANRDAFIVCFRSKYTYNVLRPITYIRKVIDPNWLPYIPTPPHPEYPAAHALITGATMQAAAKVLGDQVTVTDHSYDFRGWAPRTFTSLWKVAEEAGISRLYGGIHYQPSINTGLVMGYDIGNKIGMIKLAE